MTAAASKASVIFFNVIPTVLIFTMSQFIPVTKKAANMGECSTSSESIETQYDQGQPEVVVKASESLSTPSSKLTTTLSKCQDYKPKALRWWFHEFLIACLATCVFLGPTEYAIQAPLASNQEDLVSQLWSRSIEEGNVNRLSVPEQKWSPYQRKASISGNATSSQSGAYTITTDDFLAPGHLFSVWTASTNSLYPSPTNMHATLSTELLLAFGEPTDKDSFVPASPSSTTSDPYPLTTGTVTLNPESQAIVSIGSSLNHSSLTQTTRSRTDIFHGGIEEDSTSRY